MRKSKVFPPVVIYPDGTIVNGHARVYVAIQGGLKTLDVLVVRRPAKGAK